MDNSMEYYNSKHFTAEEIDKRLLQNYYDDAVKAGYEGSKDEFLNQIANLGVYFLGKFNSIDEALAAAAGYDIISDLNKHILVYKITNISSPQVMSTGIIFQVRHNSPNVERQICTQYRLFDGSTRRSFMRTIDVMTEKLIDDWTPIMLFTRYSVDDSSIVYGYTTPNTSSALSEKVELFRIPNANDYIQDLGNFSEWPDMLTAAANKANNSSIMVMRFTISSLSKSGVIEQQVSDTRTLQTLKWDGCETIRFITFSDSTKNTPSNPTEDFKHIRTLPTSLHYNSEAMVLSFRQKDGSGGYISGLDGSIDFGNVRLPVANNIISGLARLYTKEDILNSSSLSELTDGSPNASFIKEVLYQWNFGVESRRQFGIFEPINHHQFSGYIGSKVYVKGEVDLVNTYPYSLLTVVENLYKAVLLSYSGGFVAYGEDGSELLRGSFTNIQGLTLESTDGGYTYGFLPKHFKDAYPNVDWIRYFITLEALEEYNPSIHQIND